MSATAAAASGDPNGSIHSGLADAAATRETGATSPAEPAAAATVNGTTDGVPGLLAQIETLKKQQADARKVRQKIARDLRNAQRRKRRLKTKARMLSNDDLVAVLLMRQETAVATPDCPPEPLAGEGGAENEEAVSPPPKKAKKDD